MLKIIIGVAILTVFCYFVSPYNLVGDSYINHSELNNPTYDEMIEFLEMDKTNNHEYTEEYECRQFANDLIYNASKEKIKVGFVSLDVIDSDIYHSAVAFFTERGVYIVEPQTDDFINIYDYENYEIYWSPRLYNVD